MEDRRQAPSGSSTSSGVSSSSGSASSAIATDHTAAAVLPSANLVLAALSTVHSLCQQVRDRPRACLQAHARLHQVFLRITSAAKHDALMPRFRLSHFTAVLAQLRSILEQHLRLRNLVARMMASRRLLAGLVRVHHDLSAVIVDGALASSSSALLDWKQQFSICRQQDEKALHDTLMALLSTPTFATKEFPGERRQALVLLELVAEFGVSEPPRGHSWQLLETLKMTHRRISNHCDLHLRRVPRWFLPGCEVDFSFSEHAIGRSRGSFGSTLQRGEAYSYRSSSDGAMTSNATYTVAVKCLWALPDVHYQLVEQLFARSGVAKWTRVRHPNVVAVRGACHAASPPYIVRDFTTYGSLTAYLIALQARANERAGPQSSSEKMETLTWQLLYGASRGLLHLHEQHGIVHGGLRCNNVLVDKKGHAVVADFGLYALACDARDSGLTEFFQLDVLNAEDEELIRWQAPECLREHEAYRESLTSLTGAETSMSGMSASATSFATDVYAFGMCILEALTRTVPWEDLEISEIRALKKNLGLLPPRPPLLSSKAWALIEKMCAADPLKRISLSEASQEIKKLGYGDRVSSRSRENSRQDLVAMEQQALSRSRNSSRQDLAAMEQQALSRSRNSSRQDLAAMEQQTLSRSRNSSRQDLAAMEQQALSRSRNSSRQDLAAMVNNSPKIDRVPSDNSLASDRSSVRSRTGSSPRKPAEKHPEEDVSDVQDDEAKLVILGPEEEAAEEVKQATKSVTQSHTAEPEAPSGPEERPTVTEGRPTTPSVVADSVASEASTVEMAVRRRTKCQAAGARRDRTSRSGVKVSGSSKVSSIWDSRVCEEGSGNIWEAPEVETKAKTPCKSREVVRSMHPAKPGDEAEGSSPSSPTASVEELTNSDGSNGYESLPQEAEINSENVEADQPEREMEGERNSAGGPSTEEDKEASEEPAQTAGHEDVEPEKVGDAEETAGGSSTEDEEFMERPSFVPTEYMTARSYDDLKDLDDDAAGADRDSDPETSDNSADPTPPAHPVIVLINTLKEDSPDGVKLVETLQALKDELELSTAWLIVERDGLLALMELVWREYSEQSVMLALEMLQAIAKLSPEFITALVESKVVKILLAVVKHRSSPKQVDLAVSLLLNVIAEDDSAKEQLWKHDGIAIMEDSLVINRRLVQEIKSTMAKFKRSEGYRCLNDGEYHVAINKFTDAIKLDRKRAGYYGDRSLAYMESGMFKKAAEDANRCMRYNPYDVTGYLRHGLALKALGKYNEAIVTLRKGRQVDPKFAKIRDVLAEVEAIRKGEAQGGAPVHRRVTAAEAAKLKKKDGDDALRKKDYALAIACYSEALELDAKNDWVFLHRSIAYAGCGEHAKAIEDASKCIRINYRQVEGYYRLALALHAAGQHDQALATLYQGHEVDPQHGGIKRFISQLEEEEAKSAGLTLPEWFKEKGYRKFQLRSYEEAIKFYTKAIEASQSDDDEVTIHCYLYRSRANQTRGEFNAVIADCSHVLAHQPTNVFARLRRADAYEQQRDFHMAIKDIRELVALNPEYEDAHARLRSLEHRCRLMPSNPLQQSTAEVDL